jgi:hypothetical protein
MIRKLTLFDQAQISEASQIEAAQETAPVSDRLGIAGTVDTFENATATSIDYSNFTQPEEPAVAVSQDTSLSETVDASQIFDSIAEVEQPEVQPEQLMRWQDLIPRFGSGPSSSLKQRILSRDTEIQTEAYHAEEFTDRRRTSVEYAAPSEKASAVDSISMPTAVQEQLVDDLLRQVEQLLITVPEDQRPYFEEMFDRLIKNHFYEAVGSSFGNILSPSNIRYLPKGKDEVRWDRALEDFTMLLEELKAAQEPAQVPVASPEVPSGG